MTFPRVWRAQDLYIEAEEGQMGNVVITDPDGSDPEVRTIIFRKTPCRHPVSDRSYIRQARLR